MIFDPFSQIKKSVKPVLITGHTGFKGAWLTLLLENLGVEVVGYSLEAEKNTLFDRLNRRGKINEKISDIRNFDILEKFINKVQPEVIFHLAAQPLVLDSYSNPRETFDINMMGTVNLLEVARRVESVKSVLVSTTDKVYKNVENKNKFIENDPLLGKDPYSASKVGVENVILAYQQFSKISDSPTVTALRSGNVIGGGDVSRNRLIPDLIKSFSNYSVAMIRNPNSTRPWQHALDPLTGYVLAANAILSGKEINSINFGPNGDALSVKEVAVIAKSTWGAGAEFEVEAKNDQLEAKNLELDSSFANKELNWKPKWSQENAVIESVSWWKSVLLENIPPLDRCNQEIKFCLESK